MEISTISIITSIILCIGYFMVRRWLHHQAMSKERTRIEQLALTNYSTIEEDEPLHNALFDILMDKCPDFVVLDKNGSVCGILGRRQIVTAVNEGKENVVVKYLMELNPIPADEYKSLKTKLMEVLERREPIDWVPVIRGQKLLGLLPLKKYQYYLSGK